MSKDQLAAALSRTSISQDKKDIDSITSLYAVDFLGCMKGFLSRRAMSVYGYESRDQVALITSTLERFMDYLLQHDVCPEHKLDILATRDLCRSAGSELYALVEVQSWLPGDFNVACSTLFDGNYGRDYDGVTSWEPEESKQAAFLGLTREVATQIVGYGVAGAASEEVYEAYVPLSQGEGDFKAVQILPASGFEVTKIEPPSQDCIELYKDTKDFRPVGRVFAKPWENPEAPPEDLTEEEQKDLETSKSSSAETTEYIFFIEERIQLDLRLGMKIEATIRKLNCGLWFFDEFLRVYPSFDTFLANELMAGWKDSRWLEGSLQWKAQKRDEEVEQSGQEGMVEGNTEREGERQEDGIKGEWDRMDGPASDGYVAPSDETNAEGKTGVRDLDGDFEL